MKRWVIALIAVAVLGAGGYAAVGARAKAQAAAKAKEQAAAKPQVLELAATDWLVARKLPLTQGLPVSGSIKAAQSALVKARVAGELQGLAVREGDTVRAGQVLARVESSEYAARVRQAQDTADAAKAQIDIAQRTVDNNKALVAQGFISGTALDTSQASLAAAKANHQAALAAVDVAKKATEDTVLRAPISGQVASRSAQNGERVGVEARIVEIVDLSRLELEAAIATADAASLRVGQVAQLQVEGLNQPVAATVARISPSAQSANRTVLTYFSLAATAGLRQGLFAQGNLGTQTIEAVAVPVAAVRTDKPEPYVQLWDGSAIRHQKVQVVARGDNAGMGAAMVGVSGLAEGAKVLGGHVGALADGTAASVTQAPAATPAASAASR